MNEHWQEWLVLCDWWEESTGRSASLLSLCEPGHGPSDNVAKIRSDSFPKPLDLPFCGRKRYYCSCFRSGTIEVGLHCTVWLRTGRGRFLRTSQIHSASQSRRF